MKRYTFPVTLSSIGKDADEAWRDAVAQFALDPGEPDSVEVETGPGPFDEDSAVPIEKSTEDGRQGPIRCPNRRRWRGDLVGCGSWRLDGPDDEGIYDCLDCGLFFSERGLKPHGISWPVEPPWTDLDAEASIAQGWSIFAVPERDPDDEARLDADGKPYGHRPFELMFVQDLPDGKEPIFASDGEAWAFVRAQADAGDTLALKAKAFLSAHSPREYEAIFGDETGGAPSPASGQCRNCMGFGWEPAVYEGKRPCGHCAPTQAVYGCPNCDWRGEGAVPARDVLARHLPGDVFSDLECPECGALVHPVSAEPESVMRLVAILIYEHRHGRDVMAFNRYDKAEAALAEIVRSQWKDRAARDVSDNPEGLPDDEAIRLYFDGHDEEFYDIEEIEVEFKD